MVTFSSQKPGDKCFLGMENDQSPGSLAATATDGTDEPYGGKADKGRGGRFRNDRDRDRCLVIPHMGIGAGGSAVGRAELRVTPPVATDFAEGLPNLLKVRPPKY